MFITLPNPFILFLLELISSASSLKIVTVSCLTISLFGYEEEVEAGVYLGIKEIVGVVNFAH